MPSRSHTNFRIAKARSARLLQVSNDRRLRPVAYVDAEPAMHAALAASVSAWEAYVESIVIESLDAIMANASQDVISIALLLKSEASRAVEKFNTPSAENCRDLILRFIGFDAFPSMSSQRLQMSAIQSRNRLNETLKVRHAFAHGFPIPAYIWTTRNGLQNKLTKRAVKDCVILIEDLVANLDSNISNHIKAVFPLSAAW